MTDKMMGGTSEGVFGKECPEVIVTARHEAVCFFTTNNLQTIHTTILPPFPNKGSTNTFVVN
jgi:hypothetical protein